MLQTVSLVQVGHRAKEALKPAFQSPEKSPFLTLQAPRFGASSLQSAQALWAQLRFASEKAAKPVAPSVQQFEALMQDRLKAKVPHFKFDPFQAEAMTHLAEGKSVMVSAPTSSGKTLVANYMIEKALNPKLWANPEEPPARRKVFYTTPRKAISNEKYRDFCAEYGKDNVGLMTGDITLNPEAPIVLMTTEVLRNILYEEPEKMTTVGSVVFDECHFVNDRERGPVWEECMIHMPQGVQQLHLSATVGNAKQYVEWMNTLSTTKTELVYEDKRPVPLNYMFFNPQTEQIEPLYKGSAIRGTFYQAFNGRSDSYDPWKVARAIRKHKKKTGTDLGPAVATAFSKKMCNEYFEQTVGPLKVKKGPDRNEDGSINEEDAKRQQKLGELIAEQMLVDPDLPRLNKMLIKGLQHGFGIHHAGMTYAERALVEKAQKAGLLDMVWATDTLGAGINTSQRTAIMTQFRKFDGEDFTDITPSDFHQIIGRAGRRGIFEPGYALIVPPRKGGALEAQKILSLIKAGPDRIQSKFQPTPTMVLNLLKTHAPDQAREVMKQSFAAYQSHNPKQFNSQLAGTIQMLDKLGLLEKVDSTGKRPLTPLGQALSLVPDTAFISMYVLLKGVYTPKTDTFNDSLMAKVPELKDWELAELLSATLNERGDNPVPSQNNSPEFLGIANAFNNEANNLCEWAFGFGIENQTPLNFNFSEFLSQWMMTGDWEKTREAVEAQGFYIGDFMNVVRRTANLLDKLTEMKGMPKPLKDKVESARNMLLQTPIKESIEVAG